MTSPGAAKKDGRILSEALYLAGFACLLVFFYLQTTTFTMDVPGPVYSLLRGVLCFCAFYRISIYRDEIGPATGAVLAAFMGLGVFFLIARGDTMVLDIALLTAGAYKVSFRRILTIYVFTAAFISLLALLCSQTGIIPDYTFLTNYGADESVRHSLGIIYPTDCFAHVFYIAAAYFLLRWKRVTWYEIAGAAVVFAVLFFFTSARADLGSAVLMLILIAAAKISGYRDLMPKVLKKVFVWVLMPVCAAVIMVLTYLYSESSPLMLKLDAMTSYRLSLGKTGLGLYGFKLLGAPNFAENGNANGGVRNYTYIFYDSAYIKYLFKYGIVMLAVLFIIYALIGLRLISSKMFYAMIFVGVIAASFIIEHHMLELSYNITFLMLTADISTISHQVPLLNNNNKNGIMAKAI